MGVTGTWPELPERALNIICISLKFLHSLSLVYCLGMGGAPGGVVRDVTITGSRNNKINSHARALRYYKNVQIYTVGLLLDRSS